MSELEVGEQVCSECGAHFYEHAKDGLGECEVCAERDDLDRCVTCGQPMHRTASGLRHFVPCGTAKAPR